MNVDSVVRTLLGRGLITEVFTDAETGAIHYGTTDALLVNLGINSLDELPHISPLLVRRLGGIRWLRTDDDERRQPRSADGIRLQKVLAAAGVASRRVAENLIVEGRVEVNGEIVTELGRRVTRRVDLVAVDGIAIQLDPTKRYLMLNKPRGVVSSMQDERGRPDLRRFSPKYEERLFNVGRLDAETTGLLVLTNDGELAHVLAHPSFGVTKIYVAKVERQGDRRRPSQR